MVKVKTVNYANKNWECIVTYKNQKHMYLKFRNEQVIVSAPFFVKDHLIENFIFKNLPKITKMASAKITKISIKDNDDFVYLLNEKYPLIINYHAHKTTIDFNSQQVIVYTKISDSTLILTKIQQWLKQQAYAIFNARLKYWSEIMKINFNILKIRSMITKWGICQPDLRVITLNYKLIHFNYDIIDYVIIHELAHLIYAHHQKSFWNFVEQFCPSYQLSIKVLKQNGK